MSDTIVMFQKRARKAARRYIRRKYENEIITSPDGMVQSFGFALPTNEIISYVGNEVLTREERQMIANEIAAQMGEPMLAKRFAFSLGAT